MDFPETGCLHWQIRHPRDLFTDPRVPKAFTSLKYFPSNILHMTTDSMEQCPSWKAKSFLATQVILRISWNPKVHHRVNNSIPFVPAPSKTNPAHVLPSCSCKINFDSIVPSMPTSCKLPVFFRFLHQNSVCMSSPYVPHAMPISFSLTWSPHYDLVWSKNHKASPVSWAFFSLWPNVYRSPSASYWHVSSAYVLPLMWETKFIPIENHRQNYNL